MRDPTVDVRIHKSRALLWMIGQWWSEDCGGQLCSLNHQSPGGVDFVIRTPGTPHSRSGTISRQSQLAIGCTLS